MAIIITDDPDVHLTHNEYARYFAEYQQAYSMYAGIPPTFNAWVAQKKSAKPHPAQSVSKGND